MSLQKEVDKILRDLENPEGDQALIMFYDRACYMEEESKEAGRPIYKDRLYIKKHKDKLSIYESIARDDDIRQYAAQYRIYLDNKKEREQGVPIGMLPGIAPYQVAICEACRIYTVEKLANCDDAVIMDIGDKTLRDRAIAYLNGESEKDQRIAELEKLLGELQNDDTKHSAGRSGRDTAIRAANNGNRELKQGDKAVLKLPENNK